MSHFLQIHLLTTFAPANLNRDDLGRPKNASFGGVIRGRISSQCIKRSIRTNEKFKKSVLNLGVRTRYINEMIYETLVKKGLDEEKALDYTLFLLRVNYLLAFPKSEDKSESSDKSINLPELQVSFFSHSELESLDNALDFIINNKSDFLSFYKQKEQIYKAFKAEKINSKQQELKNAVEAKLKFTSNTKSSPDVALFGRMMANNPTLSIEAALQINHPITVGSAQTDIDYFTAIDDLASNFNKTGASHINVQYFNSGTFYTYLNVNLDLLSKNLGDLDDKTQIINNIIKNLIDCAATVTPSGKQHAFASRNFADFILVELGDQTPRSLVGAFYKAVVGDDPMQEAIERLLKYKTRLDGMYNYNLDLNQYICSVELNHIKNMQAQELINLEELKNSLISKLNTINLQHTPT